MLAPLLRENPIKSTVSILTLVSMLVGGVISVDSRYAKAAEVEAQQQSIVIETKYAVDQLRKQGLEDKIFELELIPEDRRTQTDKALLEKHKRDINSINTKWSK